LKTQTLKMSETIEGIVKSGQQNQPFLKVALLSDGIEKQVMSNKAVFSKLQVQEHFNDLKQGMNIRFTNLRLD